jgi:hypothetical protein
MRCIIHTNISNLFPCFVTLRLNVNLLEHELDVLPQRAALHFLLFVRCTEAYIFRSDVRALNVTGSVRANMAAPRLSCQC